MAPPIFISRCSIPKVNQSMLLKPANAYVLYRKEIKIIGVGDNREANDEWHTILE